ncbi:FAD binding domain [Phytophthora infestans]|uniref:FAD binding domain n=1 Tax=Phytophthora infestans TaxID=4787 RepID=A0A8S9U0H3_PHYIN|nr:FAD binding domain [Phytophthora infestans]
MGNRLVHFWQRKPANDDKESDITRSYVSQASSHEDGRSSRWLLTSLGRVTKSCQQNELSDGAITRIASHLASIDRIVQEDATKSGFRRVSCTQRSNESSGYDPRYPALSSARSSFKAFVSAQDLCETLAAFNNLLASCGLNEVNMNEPWRIYYHVRSAVYNTLGFRQKQLFRLLDARLNLDAYKPRSATNKRVCIVGAGPVGLRAAVEMALLGGRVSVLEKRAKFSRENRLHLWPWVVQDLASLGAKVLLKNFCKSRTYFHVSTRQRQVILLKVALLLGVKVYSATGFESIVAPTPANDGNPFYSIKTEPQIPVVEYTAVLGASGINDQVAEPAGINRSVFSQKESLGIVCYFPNLETPEEMKVDEFSWTAQLKHRMLYKMREVGIDLENIMYFRGEMHYLVMTPRRRNLLTRGVVKQNYSNSRDLVERTNISRSGLHAFVKRVVAFAGIPRKTDFTRVNLFDFSSLTRAEKSASVLTSHDKKLYVGLIGDSLLEPVWHEGVGTCRGFLGALDAVWMVAQIGRKSDEQLLADRELAYRVMQRVSGHHRDELQKNVRKYTVEPRSRYFVDFPRVL